MIYRHKNEKQWRYIMGAFQRQIGDMVELTPEGEKEIHKYKNNYADATKPLSSKERNWSAWD